MTTLALEHSYRPQVEVLAHLVTSFPPTVRPQFYNYGHSIMQFPFEPFVHEQHPTKLDVVASFPDVRPEFPISRWRDVALSFELRSEDAYDPMVKDAPTRSDTLTQLAKNARNIMLSQGRLYTFVVGIYGSLARIFRFDRSGAICSPKFEYKHRPELLHEFLWRLFHPIPPQSRIVGADPTTEMGTSADRMLVRALARDHDPGWAAMPKTRKEVRRIVVTDKGVETTYLACKLVFMNPELFSRATFVWEAFKLEEEDWNKGKRYIVKETWGEMGRQRELEFYEALRQVAECKPFFGVAAYVHGEDLGRRDKEEQRREAEANPRLRGRASRDMRTGHQTISVRYNLPQQMRPNERNHTRIVLETVGVPLAEFKSTKQLVMALRDAVEGHRQAYEAGVLHGDISEGNVMIAPRDAPFSGYIQDFDLSFSWKSFLQQRMDKVDLATWDEYCVQHGHEICEGEGPTNQSKQRVGTIFFMAVDILRAEITHEARHDLESFYWLLVFIVLRHTKHGHPLKEMAFGHLFCTQQMDQNALVKFCWLMLDPPLTVPGNEPLTRLLEMLRLACMRNVCRAGSDIIRSTHRGVLNIFDDVLAPGNVWPEDD
ncbi:uncharacterized protein C8Q71DRAFT_714969, partial [Rhodofomes roseus]